MTFPPKLTRIDIQPDTGESTMPSEAWKFFLCTKKINVSRKDFSGREGIEDLQWIRIEKALGTIPVMPLYEGEGYSPLN